ncbi:DUF6221 family protein [Streptomyces sp. NPDC048215]|uniref:DUF6221 family protein n=1 Tax=Streptomyces sp. NPDC048215 TaxID=3156690 RepID=UPI00340A1980
MSQPPESNPLAAFLRARLDEDERVARDCSGDGKWDARDIAIYGPDLGVEVRAHMARHDPARVLAEVEAKRRIIYLAIQIPALTAKHNPFQNDADGWAETLKQLALPYASHPDYDEGWRP